MKVLMTTLIQLCIGKIEMSFWGIVILILNSFLFYISQEIGLAILSEVYIEAGMWSIILVVIIVIEMMIFRAHSR